MRILFITLTNIGDVVMSTALLARVLEDYPDATVDVVAGPGATPLFEGLPNLDILVPLHKKKRHGHYIDLWKKLRGISYDLIIDLRTPLMSYFLSTQKRLCFRKAQEDSLRVMQFASLWPTDRPVAPQVWVKPEVERKTLKHIPQGRFLVAIAPTANWVGKQWPQRYFAELNLPAQPGLKDAAFVVFGSAHEHESVKDFIHTLPKDRTLDLVGRTSLAEAAAWLRHSHIFLGNDSGLAHLAAAMDTSTVTLFGPTKEKIYAPLSNGGVVICAPEREERDVNLESVALKRVITDITPQQVLDVLQPMVQNLRQVRQETQ